MSAANKSAYFGISKSSRIHFDKEIEAVRKFLKEYDINLEVFVDKFDFTAEQEKEMMKLAFEEIDHCDFLIVEVSKKAIGVGVEVGYAKARNKPIIYIKRKGASYSTTVGGSANYFIEYVNEEHLQSELDRTLTECSLK